MRRGLASAPPGVCNVAHLLVSLGGVLAGPHRSPKPIINQIPALPPARAVLQLPPANQQQPQLRLPRNLRPRRPDVVVLLPDRPQDRQAPVNEQGHVELQLRRHPADQRQPAPQIAFRQIDLGGQQAAESVVDLPPREHLGRVAEAALLRHRQIDAAHFVVACHVLPEIGQLQARADRVRQLRPLARMALAQVENQPADRVGRVAAVVGQLGQIVVAADPLILTKGHQKIDERVDRNVKPPDGLRQGDKNRVPDLARIAIAELFFPPVQQCKAFLRFARLVGQVIGPAAVGIDVIKMLPQPSRQEPTDDSEVLVVPSGEQAAVLSPLRRTKGLGDSGFWAV